ncbi:GNAT family N-acetyltransferase [Streptosporangium subroseum]|uniref:GNAT family N-acetyltransferase n=1 Tax=Streptosporangium subroseum TaxID=106412 RepID=UPI00308EA028|nr:GNAT family N-acetyltransferase [Streptosporangium subroseum]
MPVAITVTAATPEHTPAIVDLYEEMDRFYGATQVAPVAVRAAQVGQALFGDVPAGHMLLAWDGDQLVGGASYSFLWPAVGLTRSLFLKELYVLQTAQRRGVGKALMAALFEVAAKYECSRVEWMTDDGNGGARQFYAGLGHAVDQTKLFYRVEGAPLRGGLDGSAD